MIESTLELLNNNAGILAVVALAGSAFKYVHLQTRESNQRQFEEYHSLIEQLAGSGKPDAIYVVERLMAVLYELRNFPRYYPFTVRVLTDVRETLEPRSQLAPNHERYIDPDYVRRLQREIDYTIKFIEKKKRWLFVKCYKPEAV